jgi:hypothetical protein
VTEQETERRERDTTVLIIGLLRYEWSEDGPRVSTGLLPGIRSLWLFHYGQFEGPVKAGGAKQQKLTDVLRHLIAEGAGDVDYNMGPASLAFAELKVEFLEEGKNGPEIHPFYNPDMTDAVRIDHDPVRISLPEKSCLCFHAHYLPYANSV